MLLGAQPQQRACGKSGAHTTQRATHSRQPSTKTIPIIYKSERETRWSDQGLARTRIHSKIISSAQRSLFQQQRDVSVVQQHQQKEKSRRRAGRCCRARRVASPAPPNIWTPNGCFRPGARPRVVGRRATRSAGAAGGRWGAGAARPRTPAPPIGRERRAMGEAGDERRPVH